MFMLLTLVIVKSEMPLTMMLPCISGDSVNPWSMWIDTEMHEPVDNGCVNAPLMYWTPVWHKTVVFQYECTRNHVLAALKSFYLKLFLEMEVGKLRPKYSLSNGNWTEPDRSSCRKSQTQCFDSCLRFACICVCWFVPPVSIYWLVDIDLYWWPCYHSHAYY